jgi:hypothetical protein
MNNHGARYFANISILIFFIFASIMLTLHLLNPEFNPLVRTMSEYVVGRMGGLMIAAFMVLAIGVGTVSLALYNALGSTISSRLVFFVLAQASLGFFLAGVFPTMDQPGGMARLRLQRAQQINAAIKHADRAPNSVTK